ncbi:MAG: monofunctional biosynthetic peptidoglycan transglycosylase [Deltaproteobacteria bacterium]|nr:monofunctional biosynthetic peptidoglycan transglycosylase [Deltaproteobacteria bacterium]
MLKKIISIIIILCTAAFVLNIACYLIFPNIHRLKKENPKKTAFMEYRENEWAAKGKKRKIQQRWVPLSHISPYVIKAVIIAEDDKFWSHEGFDFTAMKKALEKDIKKKKFHVGGSTISQQLAKNLYLSPSKNPVRKIKEAILTWRIERSLSKKRIIEIYLNVAEWGEGIFGIEMAARHHYGKSAASLTAAEAAKLATVLPNPRKYNPKGSGRYVASRSDRIYEIMVRRGIVVEEYEDIMKEPDELESGNTDSQNLNDPRQTETENSDNAPEAIDINKEYKEKAAVPEKREEEPAN